AWSGIWRFIVFNNNASFGLQPSFHDRESPLRLAVKHAHSNRQHSIEFQRARIKRFEVRNVKLGNPSRDVPSVPPHRSRDHPGGSIDRYEFPAAKPLTNQICGDTVSAPDLENGLPRSNFQAFNNVRETRTHRFCSLI